MHDEAQFWLLPNLRKWKFYQVAYDEWGQGEIVDLNEQLLAYDYRPEEDPKTPSDEHLDEGVRMM